ncbi:hypothetical protein B0O80DRAFT_191801 [Mortierella sp. GBAus27b]|nr:hypothetical protein B0O80DRAFT_191801 [Mortierella sp. GBAus27b]
MVGRSSKNSRAIFTLHPDGRLNASLFPPNTSALLPLLTTHQSAFLLRLQDIPELLSLVAEYLEPRDIVCCMSTCKVLATTLEPHLWRHVTIKTQCPPEKTVLKHRHAIRTLSIQSIMPGEQFLEILSQGIPDLPPQQGQLDSLATASAGQESLVFRIQKMEVNMVLIHLGSTIAPRLMKIVGQSYLSLTSLAMTAPMMTGKLQDLVEARIWDRLHNLENLTILPGSYTFESNFALGPMLQWMAGCFRLPRLARLHCLFKIWPRVQNHNVELQTWTEEARERMQRTGQPSRIKDLRLPIILSRYSGYEESFIIPFLKVLGPGLERMSVPSLTWRYHRTLVNTVQRYCPKIRHITTALLGSSDTSELQDVITMIKACDPAGLESFHFHSEFFLPSRGSQGVMFDQLISHHAGTLQVVENEQGIWTCEYQLRLMETCPNLRRMWYDPNRLECEGFEYFSIVALGREWACLHLRELVIFHSVGTKNVNPETRALFEQLGRLVHLEVLAIGRTMNGTKRHKDMTLRDGYLGMLAGLSKMRHLHLSVGLWHNLGPKELTFIKQEWPVLQRVSFGCTENEFDKIRRMYCWKRLREERPWIRLCKGYQPL